MLLLTEEVSGLKRHLEGAASSRSSSKRTKTASGQLISTLQKNFRKEVEQRDKVCVASLQMASLEAAHIIGHNGGDHIVDGLFRSNKFKDKSGRSDSRYLERSQWNVAN